MEGKVAIVTRGASGIGEGIAAFILFPYPLRPMFGCSEKREDGSGKWQKYKAVKNDPL